MKTRQITLLATLAVAASVSAMAANAPAATPAPATPAAPEATIPFLSIGQSIQGWQADGKLGLWIQDRYKNWFYAKMQAPCEGLDFAVQLGFQTKTMNTLDRFSYVIVPDYDRCQIISLTKSQEPPPEKKRSRKEKDEDKK